MRKLLIGIVAAAALCVAGYFGAEFYIRHRITADVNAAFAQISAGGARATHGKLTFDLARRTLTIEDIAVKSDASPPVDMKIGRFTASGVDLMPQPGRFTAERIEIADIAAGGTLAMQGGMKLDYVMPRIEIAGYSGPVAPFRPFDPASPLAAWRFALEQFVAMSAASITIPTTSATMTPLNAELARKIGPTSYGYSDIVVRDVRAGKIASSTIKRFTTTSKVASPTGVETVTGDMVDLAVFDVDAAATLAMLDPARAKDDTYQRAYRQVTAGTYTLSIGPATKITFDAISADEIAVKPSKMQLADILKIMEAMPSGGSVPVSAQAQAQLQQTVQNLAGIYEGIAIGKFEVRGALVTTPTGPVKIELVRLTDMKDGKVGEISITGLDAAMTKGPPTRMSRFALKGLDFVNLIRIGTRYGPGKQRPQPDAIAAMVRLLEGIEIKDLSTPYANNGEVVNVEAVDLSWGAYVGPIPGKLRARIKMSGPISASDPDPFKMLAAGGAKTASISLDLGIAWDETTRVVSLTPGTAEIGDIGALSASASLGNVPREMFSIDPFQIMVGTATVEAGPIQIVARDTGGLDLVVAQQARRQNIPADEARKTLADNAAQGAIAIVGGDGAAAIGDAVRRFIETPRGTLTVRLTPKGKVSLMELIEAVKSGPAGAAPLFAIEATAGQ